MKLKDLFQRSNALLLVPIVIIVGIIGYDVYSVSHVELKTKTATLSTVYDKVECDALIIRDEQVIANPSGVTVPCVEDGDKVNAGGNIAVTFSSNEGATAYSKYNELKTQLAYYETLDAQSVGHAASLEKLNDDIGQKVLDYSYSLDKGNTEECASNLNSVLIRRQNLIGNKVDLTSHIQDLRLKAEEYASLATVQSYVSTKNSGVFSSYTDGYEGIIDYQNVETTTLDQFKSVTKNIQKDNDTTNNLGKLVTSYYWYILTVVDTDSIKDLKDGKSIDVSLSNDSTVSFRAEIVSGTEFSLGQKETLLVLKCNEMDSRLANLRYEKIELRKGTEDGIKVPFEAVHVVDGKKGVYVLIASEVKFREVDVIYSDDDYVLVKYDPANTKGIHLYDKIITQGKDLEDGKVYT